jgi:hypothetical protein
MKIYLTTKSIPELRDVSAAERRRRWSRAYWQSFRHPIAWIICSLCGLGGAIGVNYGEIFGSNSIAAGLGAAIGGFLASIIHTAHIRRNYRNILLGEEPNGGEAENA